MKRGGFVVWLLRRRALTEFQMLVLLKTREVKPGTAITYSQLAANVGRPRASRAVGTALSKNPLPLFIPCHRIVSKTVMALIVSEARLPKSFF